MTIIAILFWVSISLVIYPYLGFPLLLVIWSKLFPQPVNKQPHQPFVTVLVPAYNEAEWIEAKIRNIEALDYPKEKLELLIASDGSKDSTAELARRHEDGKRIRLLDFKVNEGKIKVLNKSVPQARGEIVLFSDTSAMMLPDAVSHITANFADPKVGGVCGRYSIVKPEEADIGKSEDMYWRYETALKLMESKIDSILGSHGQIHAIRKSLYSYPQPGTINDDFVIPMRVVAKGYRVVYEPLAKAFEEAREMSGFGRRVRIMAGNIQQLSEFKNLMWPPRLIPLFCMFSHKVLRLVVPFAMIAAFVLNLFLLNDPFYQLTALLQGAFYLLVMLGAFLQLKPKVLLLPYYFCMVNSAIFAGIYHAVQGRRKMAWK